MNIEFFIQLTINGILLGGFYATMTLGFSIIWGVMRLINLAHGEFLLMSAYVAWFFFNPNREQNLVIGSPTPHEIESTIQLVFAGMAVILGLVISEYLHARHYVKYMWVARLRGFQISTRIVLVVYLVWHANDFKQITLPVEEMMLVALGLSLGFFLSHFVFAKNPKYYIQQAAQVLGGIAAAYGWIERVIGKRLRFLHRYTTWQTITARYAALKVRLRRAFISIQHVVTETLASLQAQLQSVVAKMLNSSQAVLQRGYRWLRHDVVANRLDFLEPVLRPLKRIFDLFLKPLLRRCYRWRWKTVAYSLGFLLIWWFFYRWRHGGFESLDPYEVMPLILLLFFALGYVLQRGLFNHLVEGPYLTMLLVTFSLSIILQSIGLRIYAGDPRSIDTPYSDSSWTRADLTGRQFRIPATNIKLPNPLAIIPEKSFPDVRIPEAKSYVILTSIVLIAALIWFLRKTRTGYAIRAAAQNKQSARLVGIDIFETYAITFGIALAVTAVAGALMGTFQPITPVVGARWTLRAFAIVALGGLGRTQGVVIGGFLLGMTESFIGGYLPRINAAIPQIEIVNATGWAIAASFIILVIMLVLRPQGISGGLVLEDE